MNNSIHSITNDTSHCLTKEPKKKEINDRTTNKHTIYNAKPKNERKKNEGTKNETHLESIKRDAMHQIQRIKL